MAAATADRQTRIIAGGYSRSIIGKMATATTIFYGTLVAENKAGFHLPGADTPGLRTVGISQAQVANAGADGAATIPMVTGIGYFANDGGDPVVQADVGGFCWVKDDQTVRGCGAGCAGVIAGIVQGFDAGGVYVYVAPENGAATGNKAAPIADNQGSAGLPVVFTFNVPDAVTGDIDIIVGRKVEVIDIACIKRNGAGAANTMQLKKGAAVISDAIACAVDNAVTRAASIDDAAGVNVLDAGDTLRLTATRAAGTRDARVVVTCLPKD